MRFPLKDKMNKLLFGGRLVKLGAFLAIAASAALMSGSFYLKDSVYITDDGRTKEIKTNETDVYSILREENYELGANDRVSFTRDGNGSGRITINRAFEVSVTADGETQSYATLGGDVSDALSALDVSLGEDDVIDCGFSEELFPDMEINITRYDYEDWQEETELDYDVEYVDTTEHTIGYENVLVYGEYGIQTAYYRDTYIDGEFYDTEFLGEEVTKEPVTKVVERGVMTARSDAAVYSPGDVELVNGIPASYTRVLSGRSTAYTAPAGAGTASGRKAQVGVVAVNPNVIPYGSELYIVSQDGKTVYGYAVAGDTGSAMMSGRALVDVYMDTYEDCYSWGAVYVDVYVLSEGNG
ncbi:MAG: ubiquitin-like domain-containing protein [Lachnospiraceae bacterium]|nr:ubiquitin-like domain-containing protein [Ruminococcus sp.]MCM1274804.1 ubiquitin-like domain-containing protein [Lachnospiraceae bacterium]